MNWSRFIIAAARYAKEGRTGKFLRLKRRIKRYLVKRIRSTARTTIEATVPSDGCYIAHMICVEERSGVKELRLSYANIIEALILKLHNMPILHLNIDVNLLERMVSMAMECLSKNTRGIEWELLVKRLSKCAREYECDEDMLRCIEDAVVKNGGEIREGAKPIVFKKIVKSRTVRHVVKLVKARRKMVKNYTYYTVALRIPEKCKKSTTIYMHVFTAPCL